jgi:hypothetical protein
MEQIIKRYDGKLWNKDIAIKVEKLSDGVTYNIFSYKEFSGSSRNLGILATIHPTNDMFQVIWERDRTKEVLNRDGLYSSLDKTIKEFIKRQDD